MPFLNHGTFYVEGTDGIWESCGAIVLLHLDLERVRIRGVGVIVGVVQLQPLIAILQFLFIVFDLALALSLALGVRVLGALRGALDSRLSHLNRIELGLAPEGVARLCPNKLFLVKGCSRRAYSVERVAGPVPIAGDLVDSVQCMVEVGFGLT